MSNRYRPQDYRNARFNSDDGAYGARDDEDDAHDPRHEDGIHKGDINRFAEDAFRKGADAMSNAQVGETKKLFGMFNVDAGIAAWVQSTYNIGADYMAQTLAPKASGIVKQFGPKAGLKGSTLLNTAAAAQIGTIAALKTGGYFGQIWDAYGNQRKQRVELARTIAPVLDDIKGNHSLAALYSVTQADNEVIFAHRKRMAKIANTDSISRWVDLGINAGPNMALDGKRFRAIWHDKANVTEAQVLAREELRKHELAIQAEKGEGADAGQAKMVLGGLLNVSFPQLAQHITKSGQHNLRKQLQPYSALEMILELNEQVSSSPESRAFQVPRSFQSPHGHREQYPLEEYVMRIFIQHQKDMADISPNHTEIREALRQDLAAVAKPIADAIRKGDMSPMSLVRMVGEGKIIKKQGRGIAGVDEASVLIKREAPKQTAYANVDPAEYYKDAAFTRAQLKTAIKSLDGEERAIFAAMFPDSILAEAGMGKKEIASIRHATVKQYDRVLADAIAGLNAKPDDMLKSEGLAENEVQKVRDAQARIEHEGIEAVKQLKTSATNENGIEHLLTNAVVHKPHYFGTLVKDGHALTVKPAANDDTMGHAERLARTTEAANDDQYLGAANGR